MEPNIHHHHRRRRRRRRRRVFVCQAQMVDTISWLSVTCPPSLTALVMHLSHACLSAAATACQSCSREMRRCNVLGAFVRLTYSQRIKESKSKQSFCAEHMTKFYAMRE